MINVARLSNGNTQSSMTALASAFAKAKAVLRSNRKKNEDEGIFQVVGCRMKDPVSPGHMYLGEEGLTRDILKAKRLTKDLVPDAISEVKQHSQHVFCREVKILS